MGVSKREDVTPYIGKRFGSWTVVGFATQGPYRQTRVMCQCECGTTKPVDLIQLKSKRTRGCGPCAAKARWLPKGMGRCFISVRTSPRSLTPQERAEQAEELEACRVRIAELEAKLAVRWKQ